MIRSKIASRFESKDPAPAGRAKRMSFFWALFALALHIWPFAPVVRAQGTRKDDVVFNSRGMPLAGATVRVCTMPATGQPCTPLALIYSDPALTQALANPTTTDGLGNYFFYAAPGKYEIEISGPSITTRQIPNVLLPSDPTAPSFSSLSSTGNISAFSLNLTGNLTVNGNTTVSGSLASGTMNLTNQSTPPGAAGSGTVNLYTKTADKRLYYKDDSGAEIGPISNTTGAQTNVTNNWTAQQNFDADIHHKGPNPWFDITRYGGVASTQSTTGSITAGSPTLTLASAIDFKDATQVPNGHGIVIYKAGSVTTLSTPTTVVVTPMQVGGGATTRAYEVACEDVTGGMTAASASGSTTTSVATLGLQSTVSITSWTRTAGVLTINATAHNVLAGAPFQVTGADATISGLLVARSVTANSITVQQSTAPDNSGGAAGTVQGIAYNAVRWRPNGLPLGNTPPTNLLRCWIYRQDGGAGNFNLVGVTPGIDGYFEDYGLTLGTVPSYVPSTAPASTQAGYLVTTISSGGGTTTLTLTANAGTTVSGAAVLHDNTSALNAAATAAKNGGENASGIVYVPNVNANTPFLIDAAWQAPGGMTYKFAGGIQASQPLLPNAATVFEGGGGSASGIPGSESFGKGIYTLWQCQVGSVVSYPCVYFINTRGNNVTFRRIDFYAPANQAVGVLSDTTDDGSSSATDVLFDNAYFTMGSGGIAVVLKGGFGFYFDKTGFNMTGATPATIAAVRFTSTSYATTGFLSGIAYFTDCWFGGAGVLIDDAPHSAGASSGGSNWQMVRTVYEGGQTPIWKWNNVNSAQVNGFYFQNVDNADFVNGRATPLIESTVTTGKQPMNLVKVVASTVVNPNEPLIVGNPGTLTIDASPGGATAGVGSSTYILLNSSFQDNHNVTVVYNGGNVLAPLATPAVPTSVVLGGTGTGTIASGHTYCVALTALDADGVASVPNGETTVGLIAGPTGTSAANDSVVVSFTPITGAAGYRAWMVQDSCSLSSGSTPHYFAQTTSPITITQTGIQTGPGGGASVPAFTNAGLWKLKPNGQLALGGENFSASPRAEQNVFLPGALTSTWTGATWTPDRAVTITRVEVQAKTPPSGCTTNAVVRLTDGTTPVNVTISAAANSSGAISQNYAAGAALSVSVQTAAAGCTTSPADGNVVVQYKMQ